MRDRSAGLDVRTDADIAFVGVSRGLSERLEVGVLLPYVLSSEQSAVNAAGETVRSGTNSGLSDPTFRARYALRGEGASVAVTLGLLATPDWGGRTRSFGATAATLEPFVVLGKRLTASAQGYARYGYAYRSGNAPEAHRFTLGGRQALGAGYGALASLTYTRSLGSDNVSERGALGGTLGGYATLVNGMQLLFWYGRTGASSQTAAGRVDDANNRQLAFSLVHRY